MRNEMTTTAELPAFDMAFLAAASNGFAFGRDSEGLPLYNTAAHDDDVTVEMPTLEALRAEIA
ncbi:MAG TPA: hypothetical protein VFL90_06305 [Methylomirabilota bacterium]|nr:hypothetical protein [Methylomirabilota bacterium]